MGVAIAIYYEGDHQSRWHIVYGKEQKNKRQIRQGIYCDWLVYCHFLLYLQDEDLLEICAVELGSHGTAVMPYQEVRPLPELWSYSPYHGLHVSYSTWGNTGESEC